MTRPIALALSLLLSTPALADERPRTPMRAGDVAQVDGVLLSIPETARIVRVCTEAQVERDRLRLIVSQQPPPPVSELPSGYAISLGVGFVAGFVAGAALVYRAAR